MRSRKFIFLEKANKGRARVEERTGRRGMVDRRAEYDEGTKQKHGAFTEV